MFKKTSVFNRVFSMILGVDSDIAAEDACKIEHCISSEGFNRLTKFLEFVKNPAKGKKPKWFEDFHCYCESDNKKNNRSSKVKNKKDIRKK